jgi:hypothetical protein
VSRIALGWRLAKSSTSVMRADSSLIALPTLSVVCAYGALLIVSALGAGVADAVHVPLLGLPFLVLACYVAVFAVVFFNVALAAATREVMNGRDVSVADGIRAARGLRPQIARWALVQLAFGLLVSAIAAVLNEGTDSRLGNVAGGVSGLAWSLASFFVIPLIAFEQLGPRAALDRSGELIKRRWGEALSGRTSIGLVVFLLALVPVCGVFALAYVLQSSSTAASTVGYVVAGLALVVAVALGSGIGIVFRVELYRYGTEGKLTGGFAEKDVVAAIRAPTS